MIRADGKQFVGLHRPNLVDALELAVNSDSKLVLIVGTNPRQLLAAGYSAAERFGWPAVRLNVELGRALLSHMPEERQAIAWESLLHVVDEHPQGVVLVGTDLLWEPSLGFQPYRALRRIGRDGPAIATWFGRVEGPMIIRAEPGHPEYTKDRLDVPYFLVE